MPPHPIGEEAGKEIVVRPLWSYATRGPDSSELEVVWPLADFTRRGGFRRGWVLPVWFRQKEEEERGGYRARWMLFPLFYGGASSRGRYFAFFPFAGKLRGLLGQDEIDFYLFPFYWHSRHEDAHSLHVVFPFYNRVWGGGRSGARFWPFYGHYHYLAPDGRERSERWFIGWPFYIRQRNELNTKHPSELFFIFPFYGRSESDRTLTRAYFWPFFNTTLDKRTGRKVYFGFLFPYRFTDGQFDLWPFFGVKHSAEDAPIAEAGVRVRYRQFIIWPIERYTESEDDHRFTKRFWLLPFWWAYREVRKADGEENLERKLWPLFRYHRRGDRADFFLPCPLWFEQERPFERFYARLWRLFLYHDDAEMKGWEALFSLLSYRDRKVEGIRTFTVLGGLFERQAHAEGVLYRFLYFGKLGTVPGFRKSEVGSGKSEVGAGTGPGT